MSRPASTYRANRIALRTASNTRGKRRVAAGTVIVTPAANAVYAGHQHHGGCTTDRNGQPHQHARQTGRYAGRIAMGAGA